MLLLEVSCFLSPPFHLSLSFCGPIIVLWTSFLLFFFPLWILYLGGNRSLLSAAVDYHLWIYAGNWGPRVLVMKPSMGVVGLMIVFMGVCSFCFYKNCTVLKEICIGFQEQQQQHHQLSHLFSIKFLCFNNHDQTAASNSSWWAAADQPAGSGKTRQPRRRPKLGNAGRGCHCDGLESCPRS